MTRSHRTFVSPVLCLLSACSVVQVGAEDEPPRLEASGLVDGHVTLGVPEEDKLLDASLFTGRSPGTLAAVSVWKLLRLEVGLAGASVGVGPLDLGLGLFFYEPETWIREPPVETRETKADVEEGSLGSAPPPSGP